MLRISDWFSHIYWEQEKKEGKKQKKILKLVACVVQVFGKTSSDGAL